jgi:hypothetical protein
MKKEQIHACALARAIIGLWEARKSLMEGSVFAVYYRSDHIRACKESFSE